jgi:single-stranded-DNA-specific exonuclease
MSLVDKVLANKGIKSPKDLDKDTLEHPSFIPGLEKAADILSNALSGEVKVVICGDFDADGTVSTAILYNYFTSVAKNPKNISFYLPNRFTEGHGLSEEAAKKICEEGADILITVDNGITSFGAARVCKALGKMLIITDHHDQKPGELPDALILNPKLTDNKHAKFLCGAGVAFYLVKQIDHLMKGSLSDLTNHLIMTAIATVADVVPLTGDNRTLVQQGLSAMRSSTHLGIENLSSLIYGSSEITSGDVAFKIAPVLNATGRLESARGVVELLTEKSFNKNMIIFEKLKNNNIERKKILEENTQLVISSAELVNERPCNKILFVGMEGLHVGIVGIIASRLKEKFKKPAMVFSIGSDGVCKASCRSVDGFDLGRVMVALDGLILGGGGHYMAAGFSFMAENTDKIYEAVNALEFVTKFEQAEIQCQSDELNNEFMDTVESLEPFGAKNPPIRLEVTGTVTSVRKAKMLSFIKLYGCELEFLSFKPFPFELNETVTLKLVITGKEAIIG